MDGQIQQFPLIEKFFKTKDDLHYKKGDIILEGSTDTRWIYFLEEGFIKEYSISPTGEENIYVILQSHDIFPLYTLFNDVRLHIYGEALTDVRIKMALRKNFIDLFLNDKNVTLYITQQLINRYLLFYNRIFTLEISSSYERIISFLLFLAKTMGKRYKGRIIFDAPITQENIANAVNVTRETASKELNNLARKNLIYKKKSTISITNIVSLQRELALHSLNH
jgi:CRP-like cAMP-binding protein